MYILGIESSCDETAAAIVEDGKHLISNVISTSVKEQALYGGVVPEIASRRHAEYISATVQQALQDANMAIADVDAVAVTFAPGRGRTGDAAAGEAFDKVARTLGLPYPGGPSVSQAAKTGDPHYYKLPTPHVEGKYNVSFSGLKTAVVNEVHNAQQRGEEVRVADMAASFQERIAQILAKKLLAAAADTNAKTICLAGGVAANGRLRQRVNDGAQKLGAKVYLPELKYCGDNGAMIAAQGYYEFKDGNIADLTLNGLPTLAIDYR